MRVYTHLHPLPLPQPYTPHFTRGSVVDVAAVGSPCFSVFLGLLVMLLTPACRRRGRRCPGGWGGPRSWPRLSSLPSAWTWWGGCSPSAFPRALTPLLQVVSDPLAGVSGRPPGGALTVTPSPPAPRVGFFFTVTADGTLETRPVLVRGRSLVAMAGLWWRGTGDLGRQCQGRLFPSAFSGAGAFASSLVRGLRCRAPAPQQPGRRTLAGRFPSVRTCDPSFCSGPCSCFLHFRLFPCLLQLRPGGPVFWCSL